MHELTLQLDDEAAMTAFGAKLARITEGVRPQMTMALFQDLGSAARKAARTDVKAKIYPDKARAALGLPPLEQGKAADTAGKTEKTK